MKSILLSINKLNVFEPLNALNINEARNLLSQKMNEKWKPDILSNPKLRAYVQGSYSHEETKIQDFSRT